MDADAHEVEDRDDDRYAGPGGVLSQKPKVNPGLAQDANRERRQGLSLAQHGGPQHVATVHRDDKPVTLGAGHRPTHEVSRMPRGYVVISEHQGVVREVEEDMGSPEPRKAPIEGPL